MEKIIKETKNTPFEGCDFVLQLGSDRKDGRVKLLQLTDMQFIDSSQRRTPERLGKGEIIAWDPKNIDAECANQMRSLVAQVKPDLIFITGDLVYGEFDDNGTSFIRFCEIMDSFAIPWAPVFGNHDNESKMGVEWQCEQLEKSKYCLFKRGEVSGHGNYTVGIAAGDELIRVMHMADTHGCGCAYAFYPDQMELFKQNTQLITAAQKRAVPAFLALHIPLYEYHEAEIAKGYSSGIEDYYSIAVTVQGKDGDFGCRYSSFYELVRTEFDFISAAKECNIDAVFAGHYHKANTVIDYKGIKLAIGLKTGQYDAHNRYQLGGTRVDLFKDGFDICHTPALCLCGPFPYECD